MGPNENVSTVTPVSPLAGDGPRATITTTVRPPGTTTLVVEGDLCTSSVCDLQAAALLAHLEGSVTVVDLEAVRFIDGRGVSFLLDLLATADAAGRSARLGPVSERVARLLSLCGLDHLLRGDPAGDRSAAGDSP